MLARFHEQRLIDFAPQIRLIAISLLYVLRLIDALDDHDHIKARRKKISMMSNKLLTSARFALIYQYVVRHLV
jgi:hypothetical protein